jgi:arginase family enzyme
MMEIVTSKVSELIVDGKFAIALGEEHSITAAVVRDLRVNNLPDNLINEAA